MIFYASLYTNTHCITVSNLKLRNKPSLWKYDSSSPNDSSRCPVNLFLSGSHILKMQMIKYSFETAFSFDLKYVNLLDLIV